MNAAIFFSSSTTRFLLFLTLGRRFLAVPGLPGLDLPHILAVVYLNRGRVRRLLILLIRPGVTLCQHWNGQGQNPRQNTCW
jgi:hypothetical protein